MGNCGCDGEGIVGTQLDPPGLEAWEPWHPDEVFSLLNAVDAPWHIAGGWALDLWHGFETRGREDKEDFIIPWTDRTIFDIISWFETLFGYRNESERIPSPREA
jgi:hypothetical protein